MTKANKIRDYVLDNLIDPARREGKRSITFKASDIHKAMGLERCYPLVCSSIDTDKFLVSAPVTLVNRVGPKASSTVQWTFDIKPEKRTSTLGSIRPTTDQNPFPSPIGIYVGSARKLPPTQVQGEPVLVRTDALQKLIDIGFTDVGSWRLDGEGISFTLDDNAKESSILYSFVVNGEVKYIGKSIQTLYKRMYLYKQGGSSQVTNIRNRQSIKNSLEKGFAVRIYAFVQGTPMAYKDMPINISAGLEDNLISLLKPEWNKR